MSERLSGSGVGSSPSDSRRLKSELAKDLQLGSEVHAAQQEHTHAQVRAMVMRGLQPDP